MENIINKLIEHAKELFIFFYNKPWHFLFVGITILLIYFFTDRSPYIFIASILIVFTIVTIVEANITKIKFENKMKNYYNDLQGYEKEIIDQCIDNKTVTYVTPSTNDGHINAITSLSGKGFGRNISWSGDFLLFKEVYDQILNIKAKSK